MVHSQACIQAREDYQKQLAEFEAKHPNYCRNCGGTGSINGGYQSVPYGMGNVQMPLGDEPCPECADYGKCPLCGEETLNDANEYTHCDKCGWDADTNLISAPIQPECYCWDND